MLESQVCPEGKQSDFNQSRHEHREAMKQMLQELTGSFKLQKEIPPFCFFSAHFSDLAGKCHRVDVRLQRLKEKVDLCIWRISSTPTDDDSADIMM